MPDNVITVGVNGDYSTIQDAIAAAIRNNVHDIVVAAGAYTENNTITGADGLTIEAAPGGGVTLTGSFTITGGSGVTISGLTFQGDGTNVAVSATGSDSLTVTGNTFNGTGQAIFLNGTTNSTISNNLMTKTTLSVIEEIDGSNYNIITNNILDGNSGDPSSPTKGAIWLHGASNGIISHNQISNTNNAGISLSDFFEPGSTLTQNNNTVVEYNVLNNVVANTADNGAIYVLGRSQDPNTGIIIRSNYIGAVGSTTVANPHAVGIYLDDNASGVLVTQNVVQASAGLTDPFEIHGGSNNTISGNIFDLGNGWADFGLFQKDESNQSPVGGFEQLTNDSITGNIFVTASKTPHDPGFADLTGGLGGGISITNDDYYSYSGAPLNVDGIGPTGDTSAKYDSPALVAAQSLSDYGNFTAASINFTPIDLTPIGLSQPSAIGAPCYCPGTLIATGNGEVAVETLRIGDTILTDDGSAERVRWIGRRSYDGRFIRDNHLMLPVTLRANALADGIPHTDLVVSPGHAVWVDRQLIPAWRLINGVSIIQADSVESVTYLHVELPRHALLRANGALAESYVEVEGFRGQFQNADEFLTLYPEGPRLLPFQDRLESGFDLQRIQERLAERAGIFTPIELAGSLHGSIDEAGPTRICGWAQDLSSPEEPVALEIWVGGTIIQQVLANGWRADLRRAGLGSGCHAFDLLLPDGVCGPVVVRRVSDGALLTNAAIAPRERKTA